MKLQIAFDKFENLFIQSNINNFKSLFIVDNLVDYDNKMISFFDQIKTLIVVTRFLNKSIEQQIFESLRLKKKSRDEIRKKCCWQKNSKMKNCFNLFFNIIKMWRIRESRKSTKTYWRNKISNESNQKDWIIEKM